MSSYRFDLEKAIAAWRRPFEHHRTFSSEDPDELEGSLPDRVEALLEAGLSEKQLSGKPSDGRAPTARRRSNIARSIGASSSGGVNCATNSLGGSRC